MYNSCLKHLICHYMNHHHQQVLIVLIPLSLRSLKGQQCGAPL